MNLQANSVCIKVGKCLIWWNKKSLPMSENRNA